MDLLLFFCLILLEIDKGNVFSSLGCLETEPLGAFTVNIVRILDIQRTSNGILVGWRLNILYVGSVEGGSIKFRIYGGIYSPVVDVFVTYFVEFGVVRKANAWRVLFERNELDLIL
jgi:hypothetical protein